MKPLSSFTLRRGHAFCAAVLAHGSRRADRGGAVACDLSLALRALIKYIVQWISKILYFKIKFIK
jgi:hypothetical protein